ncbi:type II toxin-antitoxin system PrlF family antitoxin [Rhizobium sp. DKSPLA3]|uniref:Type II toxin-antitoxin system PrlF family antitoxin n=1 Tax=Rhizobium quercicola TaxID=2901226 RepID=A0A9X1NTS1_9HYPH|nr:type II toxin-antitoxin system PrlF family antitoxin [Rhizobium quercicola]MCD7109191.1 type II toxin-antitoxin system PrlF family antitoxin [Rhizobium quercicola]
MGETVRITAGTITVPESVLKALGLKDGDAVEFVANEAGAVEIRKPGKSFEDLRGIVKFERPVSTDELIGWIREMRGGEGDDERD